MISEVDGMIDSEFVDVLRSEGIHDADAEVKESVEERVITASLEMIRKSKRKTAELTEQVMLFYAVFAEDVPIPTAVLTTCVPTIVMNTSQSGKTSQDIKSAMTTLLKYNLLKGGLAEGSGTFMHDIVRDYVISNHTDEELKGLQQQVVETLLNARPAEGFPTAEHSVATTFEGYVARHLFWHMRGALAGDEPLMEWVDHRQDLAVRQAVALAIGQDVLVAMSKALEERKDTLGAAELVWCASLLGDLGRVSAEIMNDLIYHTADLLAKLSEKPQDDNAAARAFELQVLLSCYPRDQEFGPETKVSTEKHLPLQ